jgi:excisionase family DNA binding protein
MYSPFMEHPTGKKTRRNGGGNVYPSVDALAAELGISRQSTYDGLRKSEIPGIRLGKRWILPKAAIAAWLSNAGGNVRSAA